MNIDRAVKRAMKLKPGRVYQCYGNEAECLLLMERLTPFDDDKNGHDIPKFNFCIEDKKVFVVRKA